MRFLIGLLQILILAALVSAGGLETAGAETAAAASTGGSNKPVKRTAVNFEDQLIEGQRQKPDLFYLLQQKNNSYKKLIRLRENFLPEMRKTAEEVSR
jgi:hypothetical protein